MLRPFVPVSSGNSQNRLASFMVARADPTPDRTSRVS